MVLVCVASVVSERKQQVSALIDSTPHLLEVAMVKSYIGKFESNSGVLQLLQHFTRLLALHYDHKWYVPLCGCGHCVWVWSLCGNVNAGAGMMVYC